MIVNIFVTLADRNPISGEIIHRFIGCAQSKNDGIYMNSGQYSPAVSATIQQMILPGTHPDDPLNPINCNIS